MSKNITDVFFDLDHTLWDFDRNSELAFNENASAYISNLIGLGILQYSDMVLKKTSIFKKIYLFFKSQRMANISTIQPGYIFC